MKKSFIFGFALVLLIVGSYLYADLDSEDPAEKAQYVKEEEPEAIVLAEAVDEMHLLDKSVIEREIQEIEGQESEESKLKLAIAKSKIESLNSTHYDKI